MFFQRSPELLYDTLSHTNIDIKSLSQCRLLITVRIAAVAVFCAFTGRNAEFSKQVLTGLTPNDRPFIVN